MSCSDIFSYIVAYLEPCVILVYLEPCHIENSDIFRYIHILFRHIQYFENPAYSELCHIQNLGLKAYSESCLFRHI